MGESEESKRLLHMLFVEDDPTDVRLLYEALSEGSTWCYLTTANNGAQALDMLFQRGKYKDQRLPDMILLDLNLPILTGHEVLNAIKAHHILGQIPVLVLSNSQSPEDITIAYDLGAACYIVKPRDFEHLTRVCGALQDFWYRKATLPKVIAATG